MSKSLRVFIPHALFTLDSGLLIGWCHTNSVQNSTLITVFIFALFPNDNSNSFRDQCSYQNENIRILGSYTSSGDARQPWIPVKWMADVHVQLCLTSTGQLDVIGAWVGGSSLRSISESCDIILYDPLQYTRLNPKIISSSDIDSPNSTKGLTSLLFSAISEFWRYPYVKTKVVVDFTTSGDSRLTELISSCLSKGIVNCANIAFKMAHKSGLVFIVNKSSKFSVCAQLKTRVMQLDYLANSAKNPDDDMRFWNTLLALLIDLVLGLVLTVILYYSVSTSVFLDFILDWTNILVGNLRSLLVWLMGSPAGLKLNHSLTSSMGTFFTYHIYLWEAYLYVIKPAMELILGIIFYCGIFGLTFQLGMLNDLFTFATFHIYCFYAYAAKLYHLNFVGLISYWRLFRGKKWNPLRQRVDSCTYDVDQLFMGTLCFTTLLFLLPTTLLYYAVFTILRIPILLLQEMLHKIMRSINQLTLYTFTLYILGSRSLVSRFQLVVVPRHAHNGPLILAMKGELCPLATAAGMFLPPICAVTGQPTGYTLLKNLFSGKLIYPI